MHQQEHAVPYLARFAIPRTEAGLVRGWYSQETSMWMLDTTDGPCPAVECDSSALEMITKTDVQAERDDDDMLELSTKTRIERERDDEILPRGIDI